MMVLLHLLYGCGEIRHLVRGVESAGRIILHVVSAVAGCHVADNPHYCMAGDW